MPKPAPDHPTSVETFLLIKLMEECGEVVQACSNVLEHGFNGSDPKAPGSFDNKLQLAKELGDVIAAMHILCEHVRMPFWTDALKLRTIEDFAEAKRKVLRVLAVQRVDRKEKPWV